MWAIIRHRWSVWLCRARANSNPSNFPSDAGKPPSDEGEVNRPRSTVVPQAAEFTYILFTQEISTRDTSGQHRLSDLNKRYFQLEFS